MSLIPEWRTAWRWWSVQIAAIAAIISAVLTANPSLLLGLIGMLPGGLWRNALAIGVGLIVFVIPTLARLWNQGSKKDG